MVNEEKDLFTANGKKKALPKKGDVLLVIEMMWLCFVLGFIFGKVF